LEIDQAQEAARLGNIDTLKSLLGDNEKCKNLIETTVKTTGHIDCTPLLWAGYYGHLECVEYLLERGANIHAKSERKQGLIYLAAWNGHHEVINFLAKNYRSEFNAQLNALNEDGNQTALHAAGVHTQDIQHGVHLNVEFQIRLEATAKLLIELGADRTICNSEGLTPADRAERNGNLQLGAAIRNYVSGSWNVSEVLYQVQEVVKTENFATMKTKMNLPGSDATSYLDMTIR